MNSSIGSYLGSWSSEVRGGRKLFVRDDAKPATDGETHRLLGARFDCAIGIELHVVFRSAGDSLERPVRLVEGI